MSLTQDIASVVQAANNLTAEVTGKLSQIDQRVIQAQDTFDQWRNSVEAKDINGEALYKSVIDLTGLSTDYFYPVWWGMPGNRDGETRMIISRAYSDDSGLAPFGSGVVHIAGLNLQLEGTGTPWNGDANFLTIKRISQTYRNTVRAVQFGLKCIARPVNGVKPLYNGYADGQVVSSSIRSGCYLRGGLTYQVAKTFKEQLWYSREDGEVSTGSSVQSSFEIDWKAKAYHIDDPFLGSDYGDNRLAYMLDYDNRYAPKV